MAVLSRNVQTAAGCKGSINYSNDVILPVLRTCQAIGIESQTQGVQPSIKVCLSEFLDICGLLWHVGAGKSGVDKLLQGIEGLQLLE